MTRRFLLGTRADNDLSVGIDLDRLLQDHLLIQANSGGGKSWTVRRICEQTHGMVQQIIIDMEGEYHTLREKFDYVLAGQRGGEAPADLKSAAMLARRLMELGTSAIIDVYELGVRRDRFVKVFFETIMNDLPKELWHPVMFVVDELHKLAPENGHGTAESTEAVVDVAGRGRKRGFCLVGATQRIAKVHKDAIAEFNNVLIGRCNLDNDQKRAGRELGFTDREAIRDLRKLGGGRFHAYGPAISDEVIKVQVGGVQTTHPRAGEHALPPTPPRATIKKVLAQLKDLPHEAEAEAKTVEGLRATVRELRAQLAMRPVERPAKTEIKTIERIVITEAQIKRMETVTDKLMVLRQKGDVVGQEIYAAMKETQMGISLWRSAQLRPAEIPHVRREPIREALSGHNEKMIEKTLVAKRLPEPSHDRSTSDEKPVAGMMRILAVLYRDGEMSRTSAALRALMTPDGGTFNTYMPRLIRDGLVEKTSSGVGITNRGHASVREANVVEIPPPGPTLVETWARELVGKEADILRHLAQIYPSGQARSAIAEACGMSADGGTFNTYMPKIIRKGLAVKDSGSIRLARELMP